MKTMRNSTGWMRGMGIVLVGVMALAPISLADTPNGTLDFGNTADGTTATTANTGFGGVRVGTQGGGFTLANPGKPIGTLAELRGVAPTGGSINSVGITSAEYGTAAQTFTVKFEMYLSGGSSGIWYFFAGNGASFGSAQSTGFTGAQVFTGIRWTFGADNAITTANRAGTSWSNLAGTPFAQNTSYEVVIVGNNTAATVNYGNGQSVLANTYDLWINGSLVGENLAKGGLGGATDINAFRFYGESSTANVAELALDNIVWYNTCLFPTTLVVLYSFTAGEENDQVVVRWHTASEENTVGFYVERLVGDAWVRVNDDIVYAQGQNGGGASYFLVDAGATLGGTHQYRLIEIETGGGTQTYGPFERTATKLAFRGPVEVEEGGVRLRWLSRADESYVIDRSSDLLQGFETIAGGISATPPENEYLDEDAPAIGIYRIKVDSP